MSSLEGGHRFLPASMSGAAGGAFASAEDLDSGLGDEGRLSFASLPWVARGKRKRFLAFRCWPTYREMEVLDEEGLVPLARNCTGSSSAVTAPSRFQHPLAVDQRTVGAVHCVPAHGLGRLGPGRQGPRPRRIDCAGSCFVSTCSLLDLRPGNGGYGQEASRNESSR